MLPVPDLRPFEMIGRAADKAEGACAEPDGPILADRACLREKTLGNFALVIDPLTPDDTGQVAFERFEQAPDCPVLAVVDEDRHPIGMIERNAFLLSMGGNFGRAVYAQRSVTLLMTQVTLSGEARVDAVNFAEMALRQYSHDLLRGFIIVNDGCYLGVGGIIDLLRATTQERTDNASQLHKMAKDLRRSNRALERQRLLAEAVIEHIPSLIAVTVLGSQLGTTITAEGVETQIQFDALRQLGCVQVQGYLIGRPTSNPQGYLEQRQPLGKVA